LPDDEVSIQKLLHREGRRVFKNMDRWTEIHMEVMVEGYPSVR